MKVIGETPFSVPSTNFAISASAQGYTLNYSVDGNSWTAYTQATPAGETCVVNFGAKHMLYKLVGNTDELLLTY